MANLSIRTMRMLKFSTLPRTWSTKNLLNSPLVIITAHLMPEAVYNVNFYRIRRR